MVIVLVVNYESINVFKKLKNSADHEHLGELSEGMLINLVGDGKSGQIQLAMSTEYFGRWGEFYLDQLSFFNLQIKPNFKDTACPFGGDVFTDIVDKASDILIHSPPKPSLINNTQLMVMVLPLSVNGTTASISMSSFNDPQGGCFMSDTQVLMSDKSVKVLFHFFLAMKFGL